MTEADWDAATDPAGMLTLAAPRVSDRKLRLYLVGCCRRRWGLFTDPRCRGAVETAERVADGTATDPERAHGLVLAREAHERSQWTRGGAGAPPDHARLVADAAWVVCDRPADLRRTRRRAPNAPRVLWAADAPTSLELAYARAAVGTDGGGDVRYEALRAAERAAQADLLRCVFGNPFVYTVPDPGWRTTAVLGLAAAVYEERAFDRLPILADALEEAGCTDPAVLAHCRRPRGHARGCWVVDLLLDRS